MVDLLLEAKANTKMVTHDTQSSCLHIAAKNNAVSLVFVHQERVERDNMPACPRHLKLPRSGPVSIPVTLFARLPVRVEGPTDITDRCTISIVSWNRL